MKVYWFYLFYCLLLWGGAGAVTYDLVRTPGTDVHGILLAVVFSAFGLYSFVMAFFGSEIGKRS